MNNNAIKDIRSQIIKLDIGNISEIVVPEFVKDEFDVIKSIVNKLNSNIVVKDNFDKNFNLSDYKNEYINYKSLFKINGIQIYYR